MARRNGKPNDYLFTDYYYGTTVYASQVKRDFWGSFSTRPLKRNLQEIAQGLNDPRPVPIFSGPDYEYSPNCVGETAPFYVGLTNVPTNPNNMAIQSEDLLPSLGEMAVGCTFVVYPDNYDNL